MSGYNARMNGEPTVGQSITSAFDFLGNAIFTWIPTVLTSVFETVNSTSSATTSSLGSISEPITATGFPEFLKEISAPGVYDSLAEGWYVYVLLALAFSLPFLAVAIYCSMRVFLLRQHERRMFHAAQHSVVARDIPKTQLRWSHVLEEARGGAEQSWRLAILEADIMLNEILDVQGYKGETMADKMKQVDRAKFNSIDAAWEAHKVRNAIAHEGTAHVLDQREVRRVISLYERVFKEFGYIG